MMKKMTYFLAAIVMFSSCSRRLIDFTVISSKNVGLPIAKSAGKQVKGKSMGVFGIGVHVKDAVDNALRKAGPDYDLLVDGVVREVSFPFYAGYRVEGVAISTSKMKLAMGEKGFEAWCVAHKPVSAPGTGE